MEQILPLLDTHPTISCELARTKIPPRSGMDFFEIIGGKVYRTDTGI